MSKILKINIMMVKWETSSFIVRNLWDLFESSSDDEERNITSTDFDIERSI